MISGVGFERKKLLIFKHINTFFEGQVTSGVTHRASLKAANPSCQHVLSQVAGRASCLPRKCLKKNEAWHSGGGGQRDDFALFGHIWPGVELQICEGC